MRTVDRQNRLDQSVGNRLGQLHAAHRANAMDGVSQRFGVNEANPKGFPQGMGKQS